MRKHLFLGLFLPFILVLSAVGTGFAVYFFGENQDQSKTNHKVVVEDDIDSSFGTIYLAYGEEEDENFIDYNTTDAHIEPFIYITQTDVSFASPIKAKFIFNNGIRTSDEMKAYFSQFTYSLSYEITLSDTFLTYFRLVYPAMDSDTAKTTSGYMTNTTIGTGDDKKMIKVAFDDETITTTTEKFDTYAAGAFTFKGEMTLPMIISYRSGCIPTSEAAFSSMWDKINTSVAKGSPLIDLKFHLIVSSNS